MEGYLYELLERDCNQQILLWMKTNSGNLQGVVCFNKQVEIKASQRKIDEIVFYFFDYLN